MNYHPAPIALKLAILLLLCQPSAQAEDNYSTQLIATQEVTSTELRTPELILDQLQSQTQELKSILSQQDRDMTLIKTKTAWIRHLLIEITDWSDNPPVAMHSELSPSFLITINNMLQEVDRDDMLDSAELQILVTLHAQAEKYLSNSHTASKSKKNTQQKNEKSGH